MVHRDSRARYRLVKFLFTALLSALLSNACVGADEDDDSPMGGEIPTVEQLRADSIYMGERFAENYHPTGMLIDLSDDRQYQFVRNRMLFAGLTKESAPALYAGLEQGRADALAGVKSPASAPKSLGDGKQCGQFGFVQEVTIEKISSRATYDCFERQSGVNYMLRDHALWLGDELVDYRVSEGNPEAVDTLLIAEAVTPMAFKDTSSVQVVFPPVNCNSFQGAQTASGTHFVFFECDEINSTAQASEEGCTIDGTAIPECPAVKLNMLHPQNVTGDSNHPINGTDPSLTGEILVCLNREWLVGANDCDYLHSTTPAQCGPDQICLSPSCTLTGATTCTPFNIKDNPDGSPYIYGKMYIPIEGNQEFQAKGDTTPADPGDDPVAIKNAEAWLTLNGPGEYSTAGGICAVNNSFSFSECIEFENVKFAGTPTTQWKLKFKCVPRFDDATWEKSCIDNRESATLNVAITILAELPTGDFGTYSFWWHSQFARSKNVDLLNDKPFMSFQWGCLAPGTKIRMADGSLKPIEDIRSDEMVLSNDQSDSLSVTELMTGIETQPMVYIEDDQGHSLSMTVGHPVPLVSGRIVQARELEVGDLVWTEIGSAVLTVVEHREYHGEIYNLTLGTEEELTQRSEKESTMFANGIMVGDARMQEAVYKARVAAENTATRVYPEELREDYRNAEMRMAVRRAVRSAVDVVKVAKWSSTIGRKSANTGGQP
jgi:hypothetical protein